MSIIPESERQEFVHSSESKAEKCGPLPLLPQGIELTHFDSFFPMNYHFLYFIFRPEYYK